MSAGTPTPGGGAPAGLYVLRRPRRVPVLTDDWALRLRIALLVVLLVLLAGGAVGLARAEEEEPVEVPRYQPSSRGGREAVRELAEQHFAPEWVSWAVATARCESGWDLYAYSGGFDRRLGVWYSFHGALQVDSVTWGRKALELFGGHLSEPAVNFAMASWIATNLGRYHWPYCGR